MSHSLNILYGFISFNQEKEPFDSIKYALSSFRHNHVKDFQEDFIHLGTQTYSNSLEFKDEQLLYSENNCQIISTGRIDNREEICQLLGLETNDSICNQVLLLKLYLQKGDDFVKLIEGDWQLVIWDKNKQSTLIARDQFGLTGMYYRKEENYLAFSSVLKGLLQFDEENLQINETYLAGIMTVWSAKNNDAAFKNIFTLPPAHYLKIEHGKSQLIRYWTAEKTPILHLKKASDYVQRFSQLLQQSVFYRVKNSQKIGTQLSSGFDSSTVTTVASEILKKEGKSLIAYTSIPKENTSEAFSAHTATDESYLSIPTAKFLGNVENVLIRSEKVSILQDLKDSFELHQVPLHAAGNLYWIHEIYREAQKHDIDTILIGQTGNSTISWTGYPEGFQLKAFIKNKILKYDDHFIKLTPLSYINFLIKKLKKETSKETPQNTWEAYSFINLQFAEKIHLNEKMKETGHDPTFKKGMRSFQDRINFINPQYSTIGEFWQNLSYNFNIPTYDPTRDKRLVEYLISVPNEYYFRNNKPKWLLITAMKGRLLDALIHQKKKGRQATDLAIKITEEAQDFKQLLDSFKNNDSIKYYIDLSKLEDYLSSIIDNPRDLGSYMKAILLTRGISCALFIEKFSSKSFN